MHGQRLRPVILVLLAALIVPTCRKPAVNEPPFSPGIPSGPTQGDTGIAYLYAACCLDPDDDSVFIRFNWGNGPVTSWSEPVASGETIAVSHSWSDSGSFQVSVQAMDLDGLITGWSKPLHVAVATNLPPDSPSRPAGPASACLNRGYEYQATASDAEGERVAVRFSWGDGDTSDWSPWFESGGFTSRVHAWPDTGEYEVQAQARDISGGLSDWSTARTVRALDAKWYFATGGRVRTSPAIGPDGTVCVGSYDGCLYAVNPDGSLRWRYQAFDYISSSPAVGPDGVIYVGSDDEHLHAVYPDGTLCWARQTEDLVRSSPAIGLDGKVYVGSNDNHLYSVHLDGALKWRYRADADVESPPAIAADGTVYVGSDDNNLYAIDPGGNLKWAYQTGANITSSPAIAADGTVYVGSCDNRLRALGPDGSLLWCFVTGGDICAGPAIDPDNTIYVGSADFCLYALRPDGTLKWSYATDGRVRTAPAVAADGTVYVGSDDGCLHAVGPDGLLRRKWRLPDDIRSSPAIADDGTVYVGCDDGCLYAIQGQSPLADSPWPRWQHDAQNTGRAGP